MSESPRERIKHYNGLLLTHHRFVGGTVLRGHGLNTRVFEWIDRRTSCAWGADFTPDTEAGSWLDRFMLKGEQDEELGYPGTGTSEAWLSIARQDDGGTIVQRFEYGTGAIKGINPYVAVARSKIRTPYSRVSVEHIRGGLGYSREIMPPFPRDTADNTSHTVALQTATSQIIALSR